jgi:hypothetical protein
VPGENIAGMVILQFIEAVWKYWWALMSCAAFTILGVWAEYFSKTNHWIVKASFVLTVLFLLIACFFAWRDQHSKVNALTEQLGRAEKVYSDARPRMGINVIGGSGIKAWNEAADAGIHRSTSLFSI